MGPRASDVAVRFNDAITARDVDRLAALMTPDHRFVDATGAVTDGRDACVAAWRSFCSSFPDYRNVFDAIERRGDLVVMRGRSVCSVPELDGPALWSARVAGDRLSEWRVYEDQPETRRALGFAPTRGGSR